MPKNLLFNVITDKTEKEKTAPKNIVLTRRTHATGTEYYFFELPENHTEVGDYILGKHHLSVYAEPDNKDQYHYTAYFKDKKGNLFRLHLYFNERDAYVGVPMLSRVGNDLKPTSDVDCAVYHEAFKALANDSIELVMGQLRKDQNILVAQLRAAYRELDKKARKLSENLEENRVAYLAVIDLQIAKLEELGRYTDDVPELVYLKKLKQTQEASSPDQAVSRLERKEHKGDTKEHKSADVEEFTASKSSSEITSKKTEFAKKITALKEQVEQLKHLEGNELIEALRAANEQLFLLEVEADKVNSFNGFYTLRAIRESIDVVGGKELNDLLKAGKYKEAESLRPFFRLIPGWKILLTIAQADFRLLDFFLKNGVIQLPYTNFSIQGKRYSSMVSYYMQQAETVAPAATDTEAETIKKAANHAALINCLDVLIKNGQTLMELDSNTGLPFAALLLDSNHPLSTVLYRHEESVLTNPKFYSQLNKTVAIIIARSDKYDSEERAYIKYMHEMHKLQMLCVQKMGFSLVQFNYEVHKHILEKLGDFWVDLYQNDLDLYACKQRVNKSFITLLQVKSTDVNTIKKDIRMAYDTFKLLIDAFANSKGLTPQKFKQKIIGFYNHTKIMIELTKDLMESDSFLKSSHKTVKAAQAALKSNMQAKANYVQHCDTDMATFEPALATVTVDKRFEKVEKKQEDKTASRAPAQTTSLLDTMSLTAADNQEEDKSSRARGAGRRRRGCGMVGAGARKEQEPVRYILTFLGHQMSREDSDKLETSARPGTP